MHSMPRLRAAVPGLALILVVAAATAGDAKTKRFKPLDFVPHDSSVNSIRTPVLVGCSTAAAQFVAPLGLPVGATLTGLRFYSNGAAAPRTASLFRFAYPAAPEPIGIVGSDASVPSIVTPALTAGGLTPDAAARVIDTDHLYYVKLDCVPDTAIWAVEVDYTP
jgi:hypothetical protein